MPVEAEGESGEMSSAQESLAEAEKSGNLRSRAAWQNLLQVGLICLLIGLLRPSCVTERRRLLCQVM